VAKALTLPAIPLMKHAIGAGTPNPGRPGSQYEPAKPGPSTMPVQCIPVGLSPNEPSLFHGCV
jgi:hypothetical protein